MDFQSLLSGLTPMLGVLGVTKLAAEFQDLAANQDQPWKQVSLLLLADAVKAHGLAGIEVAHQAVMDLFDHKVPNIDWANPRTASDIVAKFQNTEADHKSAATDFFVKVGASLGTVFSAMIKGMLAA